MKTTNRIINCVEGIDTSKAWEKKVANYFKLADNKDIFISSIGMKWIGRGCYEWYLDLYIGNEDVSLTERTNDSMMYDDYNSPKSRQVFSNMLKNKVLSLLDDNKELINEIITEDEI